MAIKATINHLIATLFINNYGINNFYQITDLVQNCISEAWDNWSDDLTKEFWGSKRKPKSFTDSFRDSWIENNDFEADGFDVVSIRKQLVAQYA